MNDTRWFGSSVSIDTPNRTEPRTLADRTRTEPIEPVGRQGELPPEVYERLRFFKGEVKRQKDLRKAAEIAAASEIAELKEQLRAFDAMFLTYYVTPMGSRTRKTIRSTIQARLGIADHAFMAWEVKTAADITARNPSGV